MLFDQWFVLAVRHTTHQRFCASQAIDSGPPWSSSLQVPLSASMAPVRLHSSNPNLCAELVDFQPPVSRLTDSVECASDYIKLQEEFCTIAQKGKQAVCTAATLGRYWVRYLPVSFIPYVKIKGLFWFTTICILFLYSSIDYRLCWL